MTLRPEKLEAMEAALKACREAAADMTSEEKKYATLNSPNYRQLVDHCRNVPIEHALKEILDRIGGIADEGLAMDIHNESAADMVSRSWVEELEDVIFRIRQLT